MYEVKLGDIESDINIKFLDMVCQGVNVVGILLVFIIIKF